MAHSNDFSHSFHRHRVRRSVEFEREQLMQVASQGLGGGGGYPDFEPGERPWDRNAGFNSHSRNKLSVTADITSDEGRDLFYRLIEKCDVLIENNVPETIERAKITYEDLIRGEDIPDNL